MLIKTIEFEDFFTEEKTSLVAHFNISKTEIAENIHLADKFQDLQDKYGNLDETFSMGPDELRDLLDFLKELVEISYGARVEGTNQFRKSEDIWAAFFESPAYDEMMWQLFQEPDEMLAFVLGIFPKSLINDPDIQGRLNEARELVSQQTVVAEVIEEVVEAKVLMDSTDDDEPASNADVDVLKDPTPIVVMTTPPALTDAQLAQAAAIINQRRLTQ